MMMGGGLFNGAPMMMGGGPGAPPMPPMIMDDMMCAPRYCMSPIIIQCLVLQDTCCPMSVSKSHPIML